jgi:uncharacterized protein DUF4240
MASRPWKRRAGVVGHCLVLIDEFWRIVDQARADAGADEASFDRDAVASALTERLTALSKDQIVEFDFCFEDARDRLRKWELCAACLLVTGYISDDTFTDFQAGIIGLGRRAFERIAEDPDSLAEHPAVLDIAAGRLKRFALCAELFQYAPSDAYARLSDDDRDAFYDALWAHPRSSERRERQPGKWDGRFGDPGDADLIPVRLPRLTALFPPASWAD